MSDKERRFSTKDEAEKFCAELDALAGYPKPGLRVTLGKHVSVSEGTTYHIAEIEERSEDGTFAIPLTREVKAYLGEEVAKVDGSKETFTLVDAVAKPAPKAVKLDIEEDP